MFGNMSEMSLCTLPSNPRTATSLDDVIINGTCLPRTFALQPVMMSKRSSPSAGEDLHANASTVPATEGGGQGEEGHATRSLCVRVVMVWHVSSKQACSWQANSSVIRIRGIVCGQQLNIGMLYER